MTKGYDYIIVGSGSAGSLMANRLSADPNCRVLLLEAGGADTNPWLKLPVGYFKTIYDPRFSRVFKTEPSEGDGNRGILWPRGRIVGGSSSINGLIYMRGQHQDFDDWQDMGADGWSWSDVLPHFKRIESYTKGDDQWHGRDGDMPISDLRNDNPACDAWIKAAREYGLPYNDDFNGVTTEGVGSYQLSIGKRFRASSAAVFLKPALARKNLTLQSGAHVTRVLFEGTRATGVEWMSRGQKQTATADAEVILCAGAIQSPQILQLSGIGPADLLQEHGINVITNSAEVGGNLQDHYQMRQIVQMTKKWSLNDDIRNPFKLAKMGMDWMFAGTGPLTVGAGQVGGGASTSQADAGRPDIQFNVMPLSVDKPGTPLHKYSGFTASFWACHPESRGHIRIKSADPFADPVITPKYLSTERDQKTMIEGVKMLRDIINQPSFLDLWNKEMVPGKEYQTDAEILDAVRTMGGTVFHPTGTCRMGNDDHAVLDPELRVNGVDGLRVVDASIMPKITSANTNAPTYMVGEKAADMILNGRRRNAQEQEEKLS
tara:strand:- start:1527 stop:3161 length:1635 start_codon:yes stop_codon:yes gene_type:complete